MRAGWSSKAQDEHKTRSLTFSFLLFECSQWSATSSCSCDPKSSKNRSERPQNRDPKSTGNRSERPQNRLQIDPGASSGALGCCGGLWGRSWDAPGRPRGAPGTSPELPGTLLGCSWDAPGSGRDNFLGRSGRNVLCDTLPERFLTDFGLFRTSPDIDFAAHGQCFVRVELFWPERLDNAKIDHFDLPKRACMHPK